MILSFLVAYPELAHFIPDTEVQSHIADLSREILEVRGFNRKLLPAHQPLTFATMLLPYSTVRPIHLIELAKDLRRSSRSFCPILQQTFITIDAADSDVYQHDPEQLLSTRNEQLILTWNGNCSANSLIAIYAHNHNLI